MRQACRCSTKRIEASTYAGREGDRFLTVTDIDAGHPALRSVERFDGVKFYQAIHVTPTKSRVLARLNDETPLVLERQIGEGKVLVFTSTFDNVSNDLPLHAVLGAVRAAIGGVSGRRRRGTAGQPDGRFVCRAAIGARVKARRRKCWVRTESGCCRWKKRRRRRISRCAAKDFSS